MLPGGSKEGLHCILIERVDEMLEVGELFSEEELFQGRQFSLQRGSRSWQLVNGGEAALWRKDVAGTVGGGQAWC